MSRLIVVHRFCKFHLNNLTEPKKLYTPCHFKNSWQVRHLNYCFNTNLKDNLCNCCYVRDYCKVVENNRKTIRENILRYFTYYGFKDEDINTLIRSCPDISCLSEEKLNMILQSWAQCNFGEDRMVSLILNHPNLLFVQSKQIENLYVYISSRFTKNDVYKIFLTAPQLLIESTDRIDDKLSFLEKEFNVSKPQIAKSGALQYTLHHIKGRIEFLIRIGLYKKICEKNKDNHVNPRLDIIVCSSDEEFATKVAGVTLLEYEVFQQLFEKEEDGGLD